MCKLKIFSLTIGFFLCNALIANAQSTITLRSGEVLRVIINYSTDEKVCYSLVDDSTHQQYILDKSEILQINDKLFRSTGLPIDDKTNLVTFTKVTEVDSLSAKQLYNFAKEWMSNEQLFNIDAGTKGMATMEFVVGVSRANFSVIDNLYRVKDVITYKDDEAYKLTGGFSMRYFGGSLGCVRVVYIVGDIKLQFKDEKYKVEATNMSYAHYNQVTGKEIQFNVMSDKGDCASKNPIESLLYCQQCKNEKEKLYKFLSEEIEGLFTSWNKFIKIKRTENIDW
jgi:hypothetical protein